MELETVSEGHLMLPEAFRGGWGVVLLYRAHW